MHGLDEWEIPATSRPKKGRRVERNASCRTDLDHFLHRLVMGFARDALYADLPHLQKRCETIQLWSGFSSFSLVDSSVSPLQSHLLGTRGVIDRKERKSLARVYVRLKPGSDVLQAGNSQAFRHATIVLVGMTAHTAQSR